MPVGYDAWGGMDDNQNSCRHDQRRDAAEPSSAMPRVIERGQETSRLGHRPARLAAMAIEP